jgi:hypothetical protein
VVLDRFWWSTLVYGLVDRVAATILDALVDAERHLWGNRAPTSVVLLDRDAPIDRGDEDPHRWSHLRREYLATAQREGERGRVDVVRNVSTVDDTIAAIIQAVAEAGALFRGGPEVRSRKGTAGGLFAAPPDGVPTTSRTRAGAPARSGPAPRCRRESAGPA